MANLVLTVIGDDRPGLVSALSRVVAAHGGSWDQSRMARLAGKFAGIALVTVPDDRVDWVQAAMRSLADDGLLDVVSTPAREEAAPVPQPEVRRRDLHLVGADRPGILAEVSTALASQHVGIEELHTETREAPMAGGVLFEVRATLSVPSDVEDDDVRRVLEDIANELMVDIDLATAAGD